MYSTAYFLHVIEFVLIVVYSTAYFLHVIEFVLIVVYSTAYFLHATCSIEFDFASDNSFGEIVSM